MEWVPNYSAAREGDSRRHRHPGAQGPIFPFVASRPGRGRDEALDSARGRTDGSAELQRNLPIAPLAYLQGALQNPELDVERLVLLLHNRSTTPSLLMTVGRDRRWTRSYDVKKGLVHHPRTPVTLARSFLPQLYWKDLAEITEASRLQPGVRRQAEEVLKRRLPELTQGERVSLARRASRGVVSALSESSEARVLKALLGNVRLMEHDALRIASSSMAPRDVLVNMAEHPAWGDRYSVQLSLACNPRTPVPVALRVMEALPPPDLRKLSQDPRVPRIVRVGADRRLEAGSSPTRSSRRG